MPAGVILVLLCCLVMALLSGLLFFTTFRVIAREQVLVGRPLPLGVWIGSLAPALVTATAAVAVIVVLLAWRSGAGVRVAVLLLSLVFAVMPAVYLAYTILSVPHWMTSRYSPIVLILLGEIAFALVVIAYLLRSRRVAGYYAPGSTLRSVFD